jgi:iron complex transport system substrate-binding protein
MTQKNRSYVHVAAFFAGALFWVPASAEPTPHSLMIENRREGITVKGLPKSVVSLGRTQTEILYALGLGERVVGTGNGTHTVPSPKA